MLDFGFPELLLIMIVIVLFTGPKEIPVVMRSLGRVVRRLQYIRYAFSRQFEEFMSEDDLDNLRKSVNFEERDFDEAGADKIVVEDLDIKPNISDE
ncbi:MAG: twin-arginine translocase TatA/TatE family subunit [Alphaproteobacteria bacterium]|nr:twin-arginine translocase TatA/TatE family subunit [Alphaproteobacteria bacterium]